MRAWCSGTGVNPQRNELTEENLRRGSQLLKANPQWADARSEELHKKHKVSLVRALATVVYERFRAVGDFGFTHHVYDKPFWEAPPAQVRVSG